jgi:hypothetical protein
MCLYPNCEADTPYLPSFDRPPYPLYGHVLAGTVTVTVTGFVTGFVSAD